MCFTHTLNFPVGTVIQNHQTFFVAPFADQLAENFTTPAHGGTGAGELLTHFQIEAAADEIKPGEVFYLSQIAGYAIEHHAVRVEAEADDFTLMQTLFDVHRQ